MKACLVCYDRVKYRKGSKPFFRYELLGDVSRYEVKSIPAKEILAETDGPCVDPYDEYLIITYSIGVTRTYRNSYYDIFLIH